VGTGVLVGVAAVLVGAVVAVGNDVALGTGVGVGADAGAQADSIRLTSKNTTNVRFILRVLLSAVSAAQRHPLQPQPRSGCRLKRGLGAALSTIVGRRGGTMPAPALRFPCHCAGVMYTSSKYSVPDGLALPFQAPIRAVRLVAALSALASAGVWQPRETSSW